VRCAAAVRVLLSLSGASCSGGICAKPLRSAGHHQHAGAGRPGGIRRVSGQLFVHLQDADAKRMSRVLVGCLQDATLPPHFTDLLLMLCVPLQPLFVTMLLLPLCPCCLDAPLLLQLSCYCLCCLICCCCWLWHHVAACFNATAAAAAVLQG
jgi:hypothetical protein